MGACTSRSQVLKNDGDAPLPAPANDEIEVKEEVVSKKDEAPAAAVDGDAAKAQSLGDHLFKETEEEKKGSAENKSEQVKQEDATEAKPDASPEPVADVVETEKSPPTDGPKPEESEGNEKDAEASSDEKKTEEKPADSITEPEISDKSEPEASDKSEKVEEKKLEEKPENEGTEAEKTEEQKAASEEKKPLFKLWF